MSYYFNKTISSSFDKAIEKVIQLLKDEGFGVLTEIDIQKTLQNKLNIDFKKYKILGACNPSFAYKALSAENKIGTMLPCNVVIQEVEDGFIEVSAVNPLESMQAVINEELIKTAQDVSIKLERVINKL